MFLVQQNSAKFKLKLYGWNYQFMIFYHDTCERIAHLLLLFSVKRLLIDWRRLSVSRFFLFSHFSLHISNAQHGISLLLLIRVNSLKNLVIGKKANKLSIIFETFLRNIFFLSDEPSIMNWVCLWMLVWGVIWIFLQNINFFKWFFFLIF